jgi:hypothetical protein
MSCIAIAPHINLDVDGISVLTGLYNDGGSETASCHVGHTAKPLSTKVKQCWPR